MCLLCYRDQFNCASYAAHRLPFHISISVQNSGSIGYSSKEKLNKNGTKMDGLINTISRVSNRITQLAGTF